MPTRNINLTDHFDDFIDQEISAGRYRNASEVLRAGLRLLELHTAAEAEKTSLLRRLAAEGFAQIDQGLGIEIRGRDELEAFISEIGLRASGQSREASEGA